MCIKTLLYLTLVCTTAQMLTELAVASNATEDDCALQIVESTAALRASDWKSLELLTLRYAKECAWLGRKVLSRNGYENRALALYELGNHADVIRVADECIDQYYANGGCHYFKAISLQALDEDVRAEEVLRKAAHVVEANIEALDIELAKASSDQLESLRTERTAQVALKGAIARARANQP